MLPRFPTIFEMLPTRFACWQLSLTVGPATTKREHLLSLQAT